MLVEELRDIVGKLFEKYGLTAEVVRLSQILDLLIEEEQGRLTRCKIKKIFKLVAYYATNMI